MKETAINKLLYYSFIFTTSVLFGVLILYSMEHALIFSILAVFFIVIPLSITIQRYPAIFGIIFISFVILKNHLLMSVSQSLFSQSMTLVDGSLIIGILTIILISKILKDQFIILGSRMIWIPLSIVFFCGLISSVKHGVPVSVTGHGAYMTAKGFLIYLIFYNIDVTDIEKYSSHLIKFFLIFGFICFLGALIDLINPVSLRKFLGYETRVEYRWILHSIQSIFSHPHAFALIMVFCGFVSAALFMFIGKHVYFLLALIFFCGVFLSMRRKEIIGMITSLLLCVIFLHEKIYRKRLFVFLLFIIGFLLIPLISGYKVYEKLYQLSIREYILHEDEEGGITAREMFYVKGFDLAKENFPFGVGFGRFASQTAGRYYSPIYQNLKFDTIYGLRPEDSEFGKGFFSDTFWPHIYAETGFSGLTGYLVFVWGIAAMLTKIINKIPKTNIYTNSYALVAVAFFILLLISTIASSDFEQPIGSVLLFSALGVLDRNCNHKEKPNY